MRIAICDDNAVHLRLLHDAVIKCEYLSDAIALEIDRFTSGDELLKAVRAGTNYDFVFLDIEMPGLSGFDVYSELCAQCESAIIFVSSHVELLPKVFSLRAYGFLAKPYNQETFDNTVKSVVEQRLESQFFEYTSAGMAATIPCRNILLFVIRNYELIMYRIDDSPVELSRRSLDEVERELSKCGFFRCSRSTLVNLRYCSGRNENGVLIRQNKNYSGAVEISRRKLKEFDKQLILFRMGDKNAF